MAFFMSGDNVKVTVDGKFTHTEKLLEQCMRKGWYKKLDRFAKDVNDALKDATPVDTGKTRDSWDYSIVTTKDQTSISWVNSNTIEGYYYNTDGLTPLVLILVNGHVSSKGYWIPPNDFVTPTIAPFMQKIKNEVWLEVTYR